MDRRLKNAVQRVSQDEPASRCDALLDDILAKMGSKKVSKPVAVAVPREPLLTGVGGAVWDPTPVADGWRADGAERSQGGGPRSTPALELMRRRAMRRLQAGVEAALETRLGHGVMSKIALLSQVTLRNGNGLFERWCSCRHVAHQLQLVQPRQQQQQQQAQRSEPLLPPPYSRQTDAPELVEELVAAGASPALAGEAAAALGVEAQQALRWLQRQESSSSRAPPKVSLVGDTNRAGGEQGSGSGSSNSLAEGTMLVRAASVEMTINRVHHDKLLELYQRTVERSGDGCAGDAGNAAFREALFSLLLRYDSLGGAGFQAALNGNAFSVLRRRFGVQFECFASPLNCRWDTFCSAFPDTDAPFGSLGSFFDVFPPPPALCPEGCFEANPPFVPNLVAAMAKRMNEVIAHATRAGRALAFVVVVPDSQGHDLPALTSSPFLRKALHADNRRHVYLEGAQHKRARHHRASTCDTAIYFLQSDAAKGRWPAEEGACAELLAALSDVHGEAPRADSAAASGAGVEQRKKKHQAPTEPAPRREAIREEGARHDQRQPQGGPPMPVDARGERAGRKSKKRKRARGEQQRE
jgi:phosphorylated CTD-interacting factor 1